MVSNKNLDNKGYNMMVKFEFYLLAGFHWLIGKAFSQSNKLPAERIEVQISLEAISLFPIYAVYLTAT